MEGMSLFPEAEEKLWSKYKIELRYIVNVDKSKALNAFWVASSGRHYIMLHKESVFPVRCYDMRSVKPATSGLPRRRS